MKSNPLRIIWPPLLGALSVFAAALYFDYFWSDNPLRHRFYYFTHTIYLLACVLIPFGTNITIFILWRKLRRKNKSNCGIWSLIFGLVMLVFANLIALSGACSISPILLLHHFEQLDSKYINNNLYRLDYESHPEVGGGISGAFFLLRCDSIGVQCQYLYMGDYYGGEIRTKDYDFESVSGKLIVAPDNKTIEIEIRGKIVYRHNIEESD